MEIPSYTWIIGKKWEKERSSGIIFWVNKFTSIISLTDENNNTNETKDKYTRNEATITNIYTVYCAFFIHPLVVSGFG